MTVKTQHLLIVSLAGIVISSPVLAQDSIGGFFKRLVDDAKQIMSGDFDQTRQESQPTTTEVSEDLALIQGTINRALQDGATGEAFRWNNPRNGHYGSVVPLSDRLTQGGKSCRRFYRSTFSEADPTHYEGLACAAGDGTWAISQQQRSTGQTAPSQATATGTSAGINSPAVRWPIADVRESQELLTRLGYQPGPVDGVFGPKTREAIAAFQHDQKLTPVGDPDRQAILAMRRALAENWARADEAQAQATQQAPAGSEGAPTAVGTAPQVAATNAGDRQDEIADSDRVTPSAPKARGRTDLGESRVRLPGEGVGSSLGFGGVYLGMSRREFESYYPPNGQDDVFNDEFEGVLLGVQYTWSEQRAGGLEENVYAYFVPEQGLTSFVIWRKGITRSRLVETFQELCATYGYQSDCDGDLASPGRTITWQDPSFPDVVLAATSEAGGGQEGDVSLSGIRLTLSDEAAMERNRQRVASSGAHRASTE